MLFLHLKCYLLKIRAADAVKDVCSFFLNNFLRLCKDKVIDLTNLWRFNKMALYVKLRNN